MVGCSGCCIQPLLLGADACLCGSCISVGILNCISRSKKGCYGPLCVCSSLGRVGPNGVWLMRIVCVGRLSTSRVVAWATHSDSAPLSSFGLAGREGNIFFGRKVSFSGLCWR